MTNPTRQEIIDAHDALDTLCERVVESTPVYALRTYILAALPPRPRPTMADVVWDDSQHYLAEAIHDYWGEVIMLYRNQNSGDIQYFFEGNRENEALFAPAKLLTPTGKRYTLTEVETHAS